MGDDKSFSLREAWNNRLETIVSSRKFVFLGNTDKSLRKECSNTNLFSLEH